MSKYVDVDVLVRKLDNWYKDLVDIYGQDDNYVKGYSDAINDIADVPETDIQEVKHGYWTIRYEGRYKRAKCYCSVCDKSNGIGGIISNQKKPYCPNCGAKLDLEEENV